MFKLEFDIPTSEKKLRISDPICMMGSCFSDEIGAYLNENKFKVLSNPFGTIYNPQSLFKLLSNQTGEDIVESQGVYYHWDAHGKVSGLSAKEVQILFDKNRNKLQSFLKNAKWLIITLGTSFVYEIDGVGVVANCHKVPSNQFRKRLLHQEEIMNSFEGLHTHLTELNPALNILFTVSPVRHTRDGLAENNRSKAILLDTVHQLVDRYENVSYFPSYEIVIDELRDYRFYEPDMVHPSKEAVKYLWQKFGETHFASETVSILGEWEKLKAAINHKPFQPKSTSHQVFLKKTLEKLQELNGKLDVSVEIEQLKNQIK